MATTKRKGVRLQKPHLPHVRRLATEAEADPMTSHTFRCTDADWDRFAEKGGAAWMRGLIDEQRKPRAPQMLEQDERDFDNPMRSHTFRSTDAQWEKVDLLGGAQWMRNQIRAK